MYLLQNWLSGTNMLSFVEYNALQDVAIGFPGFTNAVSNIPRLSADDIVPHSEIVIGKAGAEKHLQD